MEKQPISIHPRMETDSAVIVDTLLLRGALDEVNHHLASILCGAKLASEGLRPERPIQENLRQIHRAAACRGALAEEGLAARALPASQPGAPASEKGALHVRR